MWRRIKWTHAGKWAGAGTASLCFVIWLISGWGTLNWAWWDRAGFTYVELGRGALSHQRIREPVVGAHAISQGSRGFPGTLEIVKGKGHFWIWQFELERYRTTYGTETNVDIPLWAPFIGAAGLTFVCWRLDHRRPPGSCPKCGYDLTGNSTGICPECGRSAAPRTAGR